MLVKLLVLMVIFQIEVEIIDFLIGQRFVGVGSVTGLVVVVVFHWSSKLYNYIGRTR